NLYTLAKAQFENIPSEKIEFMNKILRIQIQLIDLKDFEKQKSIRVIEMEPYLNYFIQMAEMSYNIIKNNYERFYCYRYLLNLLDKLIIVAREELESEEKPAKALGSRFMDKIFKNLLNKINEKIINNVEGMRFNRIKMDNIFNELVKNTIEHYIDEISIYAEDLIGFAEIMLGEQAKKVEIHFDRLKKARTEFLFLLSFFLRNSTLNRFLKELRENEILNPISLSESFRKFMWKRIGGIKIYWKEYILDLIKEFGDNNKKKFEEDGGWSKYELINKMISHLKNRISEITEPAKFIEILDNYIGQIKDPTEQALMVLFFEQYEYSLDIVDDFPNYMKQKMEKILSQLNYSTTPIQPDGYLKSDEIQISVLSDGIKKNSLKEKIFGFYDFINEFELKYFSKLIARPSNLILRSIDKTSFSKTLYYNLEFKFWEKFFKINISSNWLQVRPKF
ncbi:MAG: hypothetical protein GY870_12245, partial [archaeon]|nr:hypothetical protein [archaeon]